MFNTSQSVTVCSNPFAFSVGFEHFHQIAKKKRQLIGYICHGFENDETGLVHSQ
tara:strand:- start:943 stop:1104 length:162 start_codon:yes stop_codon:yes gene_type:complete